MEEQVTRLASLVDRLAGKGEVRLRVALSTALVPQAFCRR